MIGSFTILRRYGVRHNRNRPGRERDGSRSLAEYDPDSRPALPEIRKGNDSFRNANYMKQKEELSRRVEGGGRRRIKAVEK